MATSIKFITNNGESHKDHLLYLFEKADKVIFSVGFLKPSGLNNIKDQLHDFCENEKTSSTFFIGIGMGETDPKSLKSLCNIMKPKARHELILCTPDAGIFHPKIYVFIKGKKVTIVTGSSNLTQHGWVVNDEVSCVAETTTTSSEYLQLEAYFGRLHKSYFTVNIEDLIARYKKEKEAYDAKFGKAPSFKFKRKRSSIAGIDLPRLRRYYDIYRNDTTWFIEPGIREDEYLKAKQNLDKLASNNKLTGNQFHKLFGQLVGHKDFKPKLWHSGSIHRKTYKTLEYPEAFREIVRLAKSNISLPVSTAFQTVISKLNEMRKASEISGVGENIVTEILLSYNPTKFANLNDNPIAVLELVGKEFPGIKSFKGEDYSEYVAILTKIKNELKLKNFLEIDSFFNYVYWNLIEE